MQFKSILFFYASGLVFLVGCSQPPAPSASNSPASSPVASAPASPSTQVEYPQLLNVVSNTQTAVTANDFPQAKQAFDQFEGVWSQVEDGIKEKSPASYDAIEEDMDKVTAALHASQSNQATTALKKMSSDIQNIP